jgi:hypothetical protein
MGTAGTTREGSGVPNRTMRAPLRAPGTARDR